LAGCCGRLSLPPTPAQGFFEGLKPGDILETRTGRIISLEVLLEQLDEARVVYLGETHTRLEDHHLQERILKGELTEEEFLRQVNWEEIWGYHFRLYRPMVLFFVREKRLSGIRPGGGFDRERPYLAGERGCPITPVGAWITSTGPSSPFRGR
jgi:uncharacterized iron-regulated protein